MPRSHAARRDSPGREPSPPSTPRRVAAGAGAAVSHETARRIWTLAHAHGTLLSILNLVFAAVLPAMTGWSGASRVVASRCLLGALILLPLGFFLGGIFVHEGDPGLGVLLVPPGALLLFVAVFLAARGAGRA